MTMTYDPTTSPDESLDDLMTAGATTGPKHYFGEIAEVDLWDCILEKGRGKVPFDPTFHRPEARFVALKLSLVCTKRDGSTYSLDQDDITSGSKHKLTLESLKALGVTGRAGLAQLKGKYAQAVRVDTGRTYPAKKDSADGSIKAGQAIAEQALRVIAIYDSADACKAAEAAFYAPKAGETQGDGRNVPQPLPAAQVDEQARALLLKSVPMLWQAAQQNPVTFAAMLAANGQYAALGIEATSEEVLLLTGRTAEPPF